MSRRDTKLDRVVGRAADFVAGSIAKVILGTLGTLAIIGMLGRVLTLVCIALGK